MSSQIKARERVAEFGEVLTSAREVNAMLDLVKQETERIESRFLEPACGTGNFLAEILRRKLNVVDARYKSSQLEWERNAVLAVTSLYGIDILEDNVRDCRERLLGLFREKYESRFRRKVREACIESARFILERNIIWGDALSLQTVGPNPGPIVFSEWSPVNGSLIKRRDFAFHELLPDAARSTASLGRLQARLFGEEQNSLFEEPAKPLVSDTGESVFMPEPIQPDYPLAHFLELARGHR